MREGGERLREAMERAEVAKGGRERSLGQEGDGGARRLGRERSEGACSLAAGMKP